MLLEEKLETIPALKASKATEAEHLRVQWQKAKEALKRNEAKAYLSFKVKFPKKTMKEIESMTLDHFDLYQERIDLVLQESLFRKAEIEMEQLDDEFTGAKKLVALRVKEAVL
jgi:hypothetical protein